MQLIIEKIKMIQKIHINNFKSIHELTLELGDLNIFIGENGCGKTNILEAIGFGFAGATNHLNEEFLLNRGIRVTDDKLMKSAFNSQNNETIDILFEHNQNKKTYIKAFFIEQLNTWFAPFIDNNSKKYDENLKKFRKIITEKLENINNLSKFIQTNMGFDNFINYAPENYFLRRFEEEGQIRPLGIRGEGLFKHLVDIYKKNPTLLEQIGTELRLISWFDGFEIPKDLMFSEKKINIKDKYLEELEYFDQRSANEGFLYLLFYFTLFMSPNTPSFFAIDNIDNSLNPKLCAELIKKLVKLSKEKEKQVLLTTHNPAILDGLDLEDDRQRLFTIYRNATGHTIVKRIMPPKKINGVEPVRLSEAYLRGYIGGLPKNF